jgi:hypothetical protein
MRQVIRRQLERVELLDIGDMGRPDSGLFSRLVAAARTVREARPIRHIHLTGGGASSELAITFVRDLDIPTTRSSDPLAPARAGARLGLACADIGQTSIKLVDGVRAVSIDRDLVRAPLRESVAQADLATARDTTIGFLASLLAGLGPKIIVALPCRIADGVPTGSTYCWRDPDPELLPELAKRADRTLDVVEGVELAALSAAENRLVPKTSTTLVLAIGHGVGAALLLPE